MDYRGNILIIPLWIQLPFWDEFIRFNPVLGVMRQGKRWNVDLYSFRYFHTVYDSFVIANAGIPDKMNSDESWTLQVQIIPGAFWERLFISKVRRHIQIAASRVG